MYPSSADTIGYESINDTIICSRVLFDVISENSLLVFSQSMESLNGAFLEFKIPPPLLNPVDSKYTKGNKKEDNRGEKKTITGL